MLQRQQQEHDLAMQEDSLLRQQTYLDSLENVLETYLDSVPEDSLMQYELAERQRENEILRHQLDSLEQHKIVLQEARVAIDTSAYERQTIDTAMVAKDSVETRSEVTQLADESVQQTEIQELRQKVERMQRQQSQRDSVIIMRLADLLEDRPATSTEKTVTERYYTDTSGVTQRSGPITQRSTPAIESSTSSSEVEALRSEVRSLRQELGNQQRSTFPTDIGGSGDNVVVVPGAPVIIRDGQRDTLNADEYNAVVQEQQRLLAENARLRDELSRKERQLDLFLDAPKVSEQPALEDTLATDTIPEPTDTLKTDQPTDSLQTAEPTDTLQTAEPDTTATNEVEKSEEAAEKPSEESVEEPDSPEPEKPEPKESPDLKELQVNVFFALNSTNVKDSDKAKLKQAADQWKKDQLQNITLRSYADSSGDPEYNKQLCARRNDAVKKVLVDEYGVDTDKIKTEVGGEVARDGKPWNPDDRRVEVVVNPTK